VVVLNLTIDKENDVAYLALTESTVPSVKQKMVELPSGTVVIDVDSEDAIIGFEFIGASLLLRHAEPPPPQPIPPDLWQPTEKGEQT
jgi:uncharacterized protein YuzE